VRQGVVISTWPGGAEPLVRLLTSLRKCRWPIYVVVNNMTREDNLNWVFDSVSNIEQVFYNREPGYELGTMKTVLEKTDLDEFLLLQDTFEIKDVSFIDEVFADPRSVALGPTFFHYAGKWKRSVLKEMEIPTVYSKADSIHWEHTFSRMYWEREEVWVYDPHFHDGEHQGFVEEWGRTNKLLENDFYIKRKGTWG
jgi:hypothetical protein